MADTIQAMPVPSTLVIGGKEVDGRTLPAKRYKEVCHDLASDAGGEPTHAQWLLICRAAGLTVMLELLEVEIATGKTVDVTEYTSLTGALLRLLKTLGLDRRSKEINPKVPSLDAHARAVREAR